MSEEIKIIFLDVDGVLNSLGSKEEFKEECFENLKIIMENSSGRVIIIISSTYKLEKQSMNRLWNEMNKYGITKNKNQIEEYKCTKDLMDENQSRCDEILDMIETIKRDQKYEITSWIVLDDSNFDDKFKIKDNFIQTDGKVGLTTDEAFKIIYLLNNFK